MSISSNRAAVKRQAKVIVKDSEKVANYFGADGYFSAQYDSAVIKGCLFIESQQFEINGQPCGDRDYRVKLITPDGFQAMQEKPLTSLSEARTYADTLEITKHRNVLQRTCTASLEHFTFSYCEHADRIYNNGLTACYAVAWKKKIYSYCEGDVCIITCITEESYQAELEAFKTYYEENEA